MIYHFVVDDLEYEFLQPIVVGKLFPEGFQQFDREQEFLVLDRENAFQQVGNVFLLIELKFKIQTFHREHQYLVTLAILQDVYLEPYH